MSNGPAPGFKTRPDHTVTVTPFTGRVRVSAGDTPVADTTRALAVRENGYPPVLYIPLADVRAGVLAKTDHHTRCPFKGTADYWSVTAGDTVLENAVWGYPAPYDEVAALAGHVAFYSDRVDIRAG